MDAQWLKTQFLLNPGKSKAELAKILGLEAPAISKILNAARQIKAQEYMAMRRFFGLPVDGERAINPGASLIIPPLQTEPGLNDFSGHDSASDWVIPAEILQGRTRTPPEHVRIFQIRESIMEPDFRHGEYVIVDLADCKPTPPGTFIVSDGFGYMARQCAYVPQSQPARIRVSALHSGFEAQALEENDFTITGRVIAKLQWL